MSPEARSIFAYTPAFFFKAASLRRRSQNLRRMSFVEILLREEAVEAASNDFLSCVLLEPLRARNSSS